jgi:hypothetical protein
MRAMTLVLLITPVLVLSSACERKPAPSKPTTLATAKDGVFTDIEPAGALPVEEVKKTAKVGDTVIITGRVGGSRNPFVDERAVLTLVGPGLPACSDNPDDKCSQPWDYCCESKADIAAHSATIQVVETDGSPAPWGLKGAYGLKELSSITVVGTVVTAEGPNLVINATQIYIP